MSPGGASRTAGAQVGSGELPPDPPGAGGAMSSQDDQFQAAAPEPAAPSTDDGMTWWYRWLCRIAGVIGGVCKYPLPRSQGFPTGSARACKSAGQGLCLPVPWPCLCTGRRAVGQSFGVAGLRLFHTCSWLHFGQEEEPRRA